MDSRSQSDVTQLLAASSRGDAAASERLMELVYGELRARAAAYARDQRAGHTLQPTALVHEAFLKLVTSDAPPATDRAHFFALAATAMRQILTDHARAQRTDKRGGAWQRISFQDRHGRETPDGLDLVALDDALRELARVDERKHRIVELRFFGGLTIDDVARLLDVSTTTIENEWRAARAWLGVKLDG